MMVARRRAGINVHLLRVVSEDGLSRAEACCGAERPAGGHGGRNVLDGRAVRPVVKLGYDVFPSHAVVAWVALQSEKHGVSLGCI
jgi:hypothetical protein